MTGRTLLETSDLLQGCRNRGIHPLGTNLILQIRSVKLTNLANRQEELQVQTWL